MCAAKPWANAPSTLIGTHLEKRRLEISTFKVNNKLYWVLSSFHLLQFLGDDMYLIPTESGDIGVTTQFPSKHFLLPADLFHAVDQNLDLYELLPNARCVKSHLSTQVEPPTSITQELNFPGNYDASTAMVVMLAGHRIAIAGRYEKTVEERRATTTTESVGYEIFGCFLRVLLV